MGKLLKDSTLIHSTIVANNLMNRERQAIGVNSYKKSIYFDSISFLEEKLKTEETVGWLDIGCGRGKALIQAGSFFAGQEKISLLGVDLVDMFDTIPEGGNPPVFKVVDLHTWNPTQNYDLITAVHSLHYVGDKLGVILKLTAALKDKGFFIANLDLANIIIEPDAKHTQKILLKWLNKNGFDYHKKRHLLEYRNTGKPDIEWEYVGADDKAGPNYTGQEAVNSYYRWL